MERIRAAFDALAHWIGADAAAALVAGAAGGLVRWVVLREKWSDGIGSLAVGSVCAIYLGPIAEPIFRPLIGAINTEAGAVGFGAFVVGLSGIGLAGWIIDAVRAFRARTGGEDPPPGLPGPRIEPVNGEGRHNGRK